MQALRARGDSTDSGGSWDSATTSLAMRSGIMQDKGCLSTDITSTAGFPMRRKSSLSGSPANSSARTSPTEPGSPQDFHEDGPCSKRPRRGAWTDSEDDTLRELVQRYAEGSWSEVASRLPGRSAKQCRERWKFNLCPTINKADWTPEEDALLVRLQRSSGNRWALIARSFNGRTENAIKTRFRSLQRAARRKWTYEEDRLLLEMRTQRSCRWETIAAVLPKRSKNGVKLRFKQLTSCPPSSPVAPGVESVPIQTLSPVLYTPTTYFPSNNINNSISPCMWNYPASPSFSQAASTSATKRKTKAKSTAGAIMSTESQGINKKRIAPPTNHTIYSECAQESCPRNSKDEVLAAAALLNLS